MAAVSEVSERPEMTPKQRHRDELFRWYAEEGGGLRCLNCGTTENLQAHHVVEVQKIREAGRHWTREAATGRSVPEARQRLIETPLDLLVADPRNGMPVCERCHSRPWLLEEPDHVQGFRDDYGF